MVLNVLKRARVLSRIAGSQCWRAISRAVKEVLADGTQFCLAVPPLMWCLHRCLFLAQADIEAPAGKSLAISISILLARHPPVPDDALHTVNCTLDAAAHARCASGRRNTVR